MAGKNKKSCVRCESLERKQRGKEVHKFQGVYICSVCLEEMKDEFLVSLDIEDYAEGVEDFD